MIEIHVEFLARDKMRSGTTWLKLANSDPPQRFAPLRMLSCRRVLWHCMFTVIQYIGIETKQIYELC